MRELHDELIHDAACTDRSANRLKPKIGRIHADEMILVEALELIVSDAPRHYRDVIDVGLRHHRCHCGVDIPGLELVAAVRFPKWDKVVIGHIALPFYQRLNPNIAAGRNGN
jgi:hypothetical protein